MKTIRSANRLIVAALDRSSTGAALVASFAFGVILGAVARVWMRFITTHEEFSWSGTLFIVAGFGVAFAGQAAVSVARTRRTSRRAFTGLRVFAIVTLVPLSAGAGAFGSQ